MTGEGRSEENRKLTRWRLIYHLRVFDSDTNALLGHIADVSDSGVMIVNEQPIEMGKDFNLWLEIPREDGGREKMAVQARSIWTAPDANPKFQKTGFYLKDTSEEMIAVIRLMVEEFGRTRENRLRG